MSSPSGSARRANRELQQLRINAGLSPNDLGRLAGVSGKTVRLAEQGWTPGPRIQFAIAAALAKKHDREILPLDIWGMDRQRPVASARKRVAT